MHVYDVVARVQLESHSNYNYRLRSSLTPHRHTRLQFYIYCYGIVMSVPLSPLDYHVPLHVLMYIS